MTRFMALIIFGLTASEFVHNAFEVWGMKQKVSWLSARIDQRSHGKWPINIDTHLKTALVHIVILAFTTATVVLIAEALGLSISFLAWSSILLLISSYIFTTISVDHFHAQIGELLKKFPAKK